MTVVTLVTRPSADIQLDAERSVDPEIPEPCRCWLGVSKRVVDVLGSEVQVELWPLSTEPIPLGFEGTLSCTGVRGRALPERMSARRFKLVDELTGEVVSWLAQFR